MSNGLIGEVKCTQFSEKQTEGQTTDQLRSENNIKGFKSPWIEVKLTKKSFNVSKPASLRICLDIV